MRTDTAVARRVVLRSFTGCAPHGYHCALVGRSMAMTNHRFNGLIVICATLHASAVIAYGDFNNNEMHAEWRGPDPTFLEEWDNVIDPFTTEYVHQIVDNPLDGYSISVAGDLLTFSFTTSNLPYVFWYETAYNGWSFEDVNGTMGGFESIEIFDSQGSNVDWNLLDYGVDDSQRFHINFGSLGNDHQLFNGDFVQFKMNFAPGPAAATLLLGIRTRRRRR